MSGEIIAIMILIGFLLIAVEIFLPGGIFGLIGTGLILAGVIGSAYTYGSTVAVPVGFGCLAGGVLAFAGWIRFFPRSWMGRKLSLENEAASSQGYQSQSPELESLVGKTGEALTDLRPGGLAMIEGKRIDVVSTGAYVEKGSPIRIVEVSSNRVTAAPMEKH